jgi:Ca2+-binding EF-hand superfamily protein
MSISSLGLTTNQLQWPTFASSDTNGDGSISLQEFTAAGQNLPGSINSLGNDAVQNLFSAIDADGDGQISRSEATSAFDKLSSAIQNQLLQVQEQGQSAAQPGGFFASADTDNSGGLSFDEFSAAVTQNLPAGASAPTTDQLQNRFNALDTNGDGQLSQSELKAGHGHHHHHHAAASNEATPPADSGGIFTATTTDSGTGTATTTDTGIITATTTDSGTGTDTSTGGSTQQQAGDLSASLLQALSAYTSPIDQNVAGNLVNQIVDALKAA